MSIAIGNIQSDNVDGGKQAAQRLAQLIGDKGEVLALMNTPAPTVSAQRLEGFKTELAANHPNITFLGVQYSGNQTSKAASIVTSTIAAHPDLAGIFTITTNNTEGAATGLREAQRVGKVQIVGFDTSDPIVEDIRGGIVSADVVQFPLPGRPTRRRDDGQCAGRQTGRARGPHAFRRRDAANDRYAGRPEVRIQDALFLSGTSSPARTVRAGAPSPRRRELELYPQGQLVPERELLHDAPADDVVVRHGEHP